MSLEQFIDDDVLQNDDFEISDISVPEFQSEEILENEDDQDLDSKNTNKDNNDQIIDEYIEDDDFRKSSNLGYAFSAKVTPSL